MLTLSQFTDKTGRTYCAWVQLCSSCFARFFSAWSSSQIREWVARRRSTTGLQYKSQK